MQALEARGMKAAGRPPHGGRGLKQRVRQAILGVLFICPPAKHTHRNN